MRAKNGIPMYGTISRRGVIKAGAGIAAAALAGPRTFALEGSNAKEPRSPFAINGNLVPPIDPDTPLSADLVQAVRASGLTALKATIGGSIGDYAATIGQISDYDRAIALNPDLYMQVRTVVDLDRARRARKIGIIYSFEGVEMLAADPARIEEFVKRGVRVMQLSYNQASAFGAGVLSPLPSKGLTELGRNAVARMNSLGVTVDLSHSDEKTSLGAIAASARPVLVTHAGCSAIHPHPRNKSDAVLRALAGKGGVVGIYELCFLNAGPAQQTLDDYLAHLTHALSVCGEDHVGIGSDTLLTAFDTSPQSMEAWNTDIAARRAKGVNAPGEGRPPFVVELNRPDRIEVIATALTVRGYGSATVAKILGRNFQRVFAETWM